MTTATLIVFALATLICALIAGVFLAFSDFVMRSLRNASPTTGIEAMQIINREVFSSIFLVWLLGMAPVSAGLGAYAFFSIDGPARAWFMAGSMIYLIGAVGVTMLGNVPMNQRLDTLPLGGAAAEKYWDVYATFWTQWNHLRTVASGLAALCYLVGCVLYA
ncbi:DUF1772 domain-containing protein [Roseovarius faecimaris]|uniref:DUF1772 domain-containing protein n=1 Tax=Roseovarius faecimaris TaxID=2494550 RepID=A0A6I6IQ19_9RHOB|nr:anthrone oxygenase family protein [Roseovarius faecimaris]QGX99260.1 DUF1772 domain-containing protein [Roseovarius faecimaris]